MEYDHLFLSQFISGFFEYLKTLPGLFKLGLLTHLKLLMDKASSYSWPSVRNFRFSVHTAVQNKRMLWSDHDKIRERAQTFFTHLKAPMPQRLLQAHPVRQTDQGPLDSARYEIIRATVPVI